MKPDSLARVALKERGEGFLITLIESWVDEDEVAGGYLLCLCRQIRSLER